MGFTKETNIEFIIRKGLEEKGFILGWDFIFQYPLKYGYIIDFAFPDRKLAIECDGEKWHSSKKARKRDYHKDLILKKMGWKILRLKGQEILNNYSDCIKMITECLL